ncbi:MAG: hypothetical protein WCF16_11215 [Alphaproteobacteria bacterium]
MADFTLPAYRDLLQALRTRGYEARSFPAADPRQRHLVLRHDLDMSIEAALPVAALEADLGMAATYFVLLRTEMYNPFSAASRRDLLLLADQAHAIGLHFDASLYDQDWAALEAGAAVECRVLEDILGRPVEIVSFHRPAEHLLGQDRPLAGRRHTYEPRFFRDMGYCSDSRGEWRFGRPLAHEAVAKGAALQLATHPIWWVAGEGESVRAKLDRFALARFDLLRAELARNCVTYPQEFAALAREPSRER